MKRRYRYFTLMCLLASFIFPVNIDAQKQYTREDVRALFPANLKNLWINNLSGTLDGKHRVDMIIGTDGQMCKGLYMMHASGESFFFEGDNNKRELKLVEMTPDHKATGFISGHYDGTNFSGQWTNMDKSMYLNLELSNAPQTADKYKASCLNDIWYRLYSGKMNNDVVRLLVVKENKIFKLICYMDILKMVDVIPAKNRQLEMLKPNFTSPGWENNFILVDTSALQQVRIVQPSGHDFDLQAILKVADGLDFECFEYADYHTRLFVERPISTNKKFNKWIETKMTHWLEENLYDLKRIKRDQIGTKERWIQYAEGWVEIDLFTGDYISGTIYLQSSLKPNTKKIPFMYDLKQSKEMKLQDLFNKEFDVKDYFSHVIPAKKKEMTWQPEIKKWIDSEPFEYVTLKDSGLSAKTELSTIYGEKEILIPFSELEPHFKIKNLLKGLIKN